MSSEQPVGPQPCGAAFCVGERAALRYGLPPFVTTKPRSGNPYAAAAATSMAGDDQMMLATFDQMLRD